MSCKLTGGNLLGGGLSELRFSKNRRLLRMVEGETDIQTNGEFWDGQWQITDDLSHRAAAKRREAAVEDGIELGGGVKRANLQA